MEPHKSAYDYEIIVVDDRSTDKTPEIAKEKGVILLQNNKNLGAGASRKVAIAYSDKDIIVFIDADQTYTASDIPRLLRHFPASDHVNGYRDREMGYFRPLRKLVKALSRYVASFLVWEYIADLNTGLKAFKREKILPYVHLIPNGFSCTTTLTLIAYATGQRVSYISTRYHKRVGRSKFHPIKDTALLFLAIFKTVGRINPARVALFFTALFGVLMVFCFVDNLMLAFPTAFAIAMGYAMISMYSAKDCMRFE